jgi:chaperonin cofactor prefoldin
MQDKKTLTENITQIKTTIAEIETRLDDARKSFDHARREYGHLIRQSAPPEKCDAARDKLNQARLDIDGLESAIEGLNEDLRKSENELSLVELHDRDVKRFTQSKAALKFSIDRIVRQSNQLNELLPKLAAAIKDAFIQVERTSSSLSAVQSDLPADLSMTAFLDGELAAATKNESDVREDFLKTEGGLIQELVSGIAVPGNLKNLADACDVLKGWQVNVKSFHDGAALIRTRKSLLPKGTNKPVVMAETFQPPPSEFVVKHKSKFFPTDVEQAERQLVSDRRAYEPEEPPNSKTLLGQSL